MFIPSLWVNYILKNNKVLEEMPFTGSELGHKILRDQN